VVYVRNNKKTIFEKLLEYEICRSRGKVACAKRQIQCASEELRSKLLRIKFRDVEPILGPQFEQPAHDTW